MIRRKSTTATKWLIERLRRPSPDYAPNAPCGLRLFEIIRHEAGDTLMLSFSLGKDSIAAWIALRDYFNVVPYFLYSVPGLTFEEESLAYFERKFGTRIIRLPHQNLYTRLNDFVYQPPQRCRYIEAAGFPYYKYEDIRKWACQAAGLPEDTMYATGVRAYDTPYRRTAIRTHGPITRSEHKFHAIWDWSLDDVIESIRGAGMKLPPTYKVFGSSFDNLGARYLVPMKRHYPEDYKRLLEWYPLADLVCFRYEKALQKGLIDKPY